MNPDPRLIPATDRIALSSLRGVLERPAYTEGKPARVTKSLCDLYDAPDGRRQRQVVYGAGMTVIDTRDEWAFVQMELDGYCGWLHESLLDSELAPVTHRISAPSSHAYMIPDMKHPALFTMPIGARLSVTEVVNGFARLHSGGYVPVQHISEQPSSYPAEVAESLLGTPYLWGGNSREGVDCSGLIQIALTCCGISCPGDSDLQRNAFPEVTTIERGDLLFWPGHVAMAVSDKAMIHATAWKMQVVHERIADAIARINAAGDGPFQGIRRPGLC